MCVRTSCPSRNQQPLILAHPPTVMPACLHVEPSCKFTQETCLKLVSAQLGVGSKEGRKNTFRHEHFIFQNYNLMCRLRKALFDTKGCSDMHRYPKYLAPTLVATIPSLSRAELTAGCFFVASQYNKVVLLQLDCSQYPLVGISKVPEGMQKVCHTTRNCIYSSQALGQAFEAWVGALQGAMASKEW